MPRTIRFHLDEHVDPAVANGLRRRHIDLTTTADAGLLGARDESHLAIANASSSMAQTTRNSPSKPAFVGAS